jgi:hypothetical protein
MFEFHFLTKRDWIMVGAFFALGLVLITAWSFWLALV